MLDQFKMAGALAGLLKNKDGLRQAGERIKQRLGELRASGSAGGGAVRVTVTGRMEVAEVSLSPALATGFNDGSARAAAESLIAEATNEALRAARDLAQKEFVKEARAMGLPEIPGLERLLGG